MKLKEIKSIDVYTRWWRDVEFSNPYYARKVVVTLKDDSKKVFIVKPTWGDVDRIQNDKLQKILGLPKSVVFTDCEMFRYAKWHHIGIRTIKYNYHDSVRIWKESGLEHPERFRCI